MNIQNMINYKSLNIQINNLLNNHNKKLNMIMNDQINLIYLIINNIIMKKIVSNKFPCLIINLMNN